MNNISWLIYVMNIITNLSVIVVLALIVGGLGLTITLIMAAIEQDDRYSTFEENPLWRVCRNIGIALGMVAVIGLFLPTKETMYMIAASQIGEQIIQLEEVQKLGGDIGGLASDTIELLRQNIQEQLTEKPVQPD